ncbi:MAG: ribosome small subunit-dependent GTPase A [Firmicutes bacterium]|nr:ribosome small subunit-dependent GTPase A [Bacillota bacterium]
MLEGLIPGRVAAEHRHRYRVFTGVGQVLASVSGRFRGEAAGTHEFPAVGDWVALSVRHDEGTATIHAVLPRKSQFYRQAAGTAGGRQVAAANVDTVFLVNGLDNDFNLRRMERYLTLAWESGADPVIVLNKADCCDDLEQRLREVESIAFGVPVHAVSCATGQGLEGLKPYLGEGRTIALLGSSGVGKSTLINQLLGKDTQSVGGLRKGDGKGRHTTTYREMLLLPGGGLVIDTPGMRELRLGTAETGLAEAFTDIRDLAAGCRFNDCTHSDEPGCAVRDALEMGELDWARYESYNKLQKEIAYQSRRENLGLVLAEREKWKKIHKAARKDGYR